MFKIIATLKYLEAMLARAHAAVACASVYVNDVNARVIGAKLNATAEQITMTVLDRENVAFAAQDGKAEISKKLDSDLKAAYEAHSAALYKHAVATDKIIGVHTSKLRELRTQRDKLRALLVGL